MIHMSQFNRFLAEESFLSQFQHFFISPVPYSALLIDWVFFLSNIDLDTQLVLHIYNSLIIK
jgi:hypothetical protein